MSQDVPSVKLDYRSIYIYNIIYIDTYVVRVSSGSGWGAE